MPLGVSELENGVLFVALCWMKSGTYHAAVIPSEAAGWPTGHINEAAIAASLRLMGKGGGYARHGSLFTGSKAPLVRSRRVTMVRVIGAGHSGGFRPIMFVMQ
jgi:hypothetical protein